MSTLRDRCADLIGTMDKLSLAIVEENKVLEVIDQGELPTIDVSDKRQLAGIYGEQMKTVQDRLKSGESLDRATSDLLSEAHTALSSIMSENRTLLSRAHRATGRMVGLIVDTARQSMPKETPSYGAPTSRPSKVGQAEHSLALNVTL